MLPAGATALGALFANLEATNFCFGDAGVFCLMAVFLIIFPAVSESMVAVAGEVLICVLLENSLLPSLPPPLGLLVVASFPSVLIFVFAVSFRWLTSSITLAAWLEQA